MSTRLSIRVPLGNPNHHLWYNNGTWWYHYTVHLPDYTKRRVSAATNVLPCCRGHYRHIAERERGNAVGADTDQAAPHDHPFIHPGIYFHEMEHYGLVSRSNTTTEATASGAWAGTATSTPPALAVVFSAARFAAASR